MPTTASRTSPNTRVPNPGKLAYWASVKRCLARLDESVEILHVNGQIERFVGRDRRIVDLPEVRGRVLCRHAEDAHRHAIAA
ncbi:MAG TPA: hypothetical protein PLU30_00365 [Verrucomicrobiae bacterium]|nr:hypothetical protein [Verrucomicrobiae bacterium]